MILAAAVYEEQGIAWGHLFLCLLLLCLVIGLYLGIKKRWYTNRRSAYIVFVVCAVLAAFGAWLVRFSNGRTENEIGLIIFVVGGLAAVVLPILMALQHNSRKVDAGDAK